MLLMLKATIFGGPRGPRLRQRRSELYCVGPKDVAQVGADQGLMESWEKPTRKMGKSGKQPTGWGMSQWIMIQKYPEKKLATWSIFGNPQEILIWLGFQPLWKMMEFVSWDDDIPN